MKTEKKYFEELKTILTEDGIYKSADDFVISQAAATLAQIDKARKLMEKEGHIQEFKTGARQISPEINNWRGLNQDFLKYADLLGLTPKARARMGIEKKEVKKPSKLMTIRKSKLAK